MRVAAEGPGVRILVLRGAQRRCTILTRIFVRVKVPALAALAQRIEKRMVTQRKTVGRAVKPHSGEPAARRDSTVAAVRHAVEILRGFSTHEAEQGISEIARRIGLHKSSVSRLVSTLEQDRLVERDADTHRVRLGVGLIGLAAPLLASVKVVDVARPYLVQLARDAGETISLSVWDGIGAVAAPVCSATGNVIAAITATVPMYRFDAARRPELISLVTQCAKLLSTRLYDLNLQRIES